MSYRRLASAAVALGVGVLAPPLAQADTFAVFSPVDTNVNVSLTGLTLSASAPVIFDYVTPALAGFGDLAATWSMTATETGAAAFGPLSLATFDGAFALTYTGPTETVGGFTVQTGDDLLSGAFLGSVASFYGSSGTLADSVSGGGLVAFNNNKLLIFSTLDDQGLSLGLTSVDPTVMVVAGVLTDFTGVSSGAFDAVVSTHGGVPEPETWALMMVGLALVGGAARRRRLLARTTPTTGRRTMNLQKAMAGGALVLGLAAGSAEASTTTFAAFKPLGAISNVTLAGLNVSASSPVVFDYTTSALAPLGNLKAIWTLTATETGAASFGPLSLGSFDGSFAFRYTGPTKTVGVVTVHHGDDLLSGTFLGSVFNGYGSAGALQDSVAGGGLVSFTNNGLLTFDSTADQALAMTFTSIKPKVMVIGGQLTDFKAVASGNFGAVVTSPFRVITSPVPEPAAWTLMLAGFGGLGLALRSRRRAARGLTVALHA